jgi:hypothetical protein
MTKFFQFSYMLMLCSFALFGTSLSAQTGNSPCLGDTLKPFFERCSPNIVLTTTDTCAVAQWAEPLAFDNCGIRSLVGSHQSGMCFGLGTTNVSFYAADSSGNTQPCRFTVTVLRSNIDSVCVNDTIKPRFLSCPISQTFTAGSDSCMFVQWAIPTATDNCGTPLISSNYPSGTCFKAGTTNVVYTAADGKGNKGTCTFSVSVLLNPVDLDCGVDTIKPHFTTCPVNSVFSTLDSCIIVKWALPTAYDDCSNPSLSSNYNSGACFTTGIKNIVYTATDAKGNKATCTFTINVIRPNIDSICANDTTKPRFVTCPVNSSFTTLDSCMKVTWNLPTAIDLCSTPSLSSNYNSGACFNTGITNVVYTATDAKGNKATCTFTINVIRPNIDSFCANDTIKPFFTTCPANSVFSTLDSCMKITWNAPTVTDFCSTPSLSSNYPSGTCFKLGVTNVIYTATDAKGNKATCAFNIYVTRPNIDSICATDTIKPRFTSCPTIVSVTTLDSCARPTWTIPVVVDNCGIQTVIPSHQPSSCFQLGSTIVTYTAFDKKGNKATCVFGVNVTRPNIDSLCANDTIKPRFTFCPPNITLTTSDTCARAQWALPLAVDNCGISTVTSNISTNPTAATTNCFRVGANDVVYTATDVKGNKTTCAFTVNVTRVIVDSFPCLNDTIKPRFVFCPQNIILTTLDSCAKATWAVPTAIDNCGIPTVIQSHKPGTCFKIGTTPVSYTAIDNKGNVGSCVFIIVVNRSTITNVCANDTIKPRFNYCPQSITLSSTDSCARAYWGAPVATDNCGVPSVLGNFTSGTCFKTGTTDVIYTATDAKGNKSTCSFAVTVKNPCATDSIKPRFNTCPTNIVVTSTDSCSKVQWATPSATDNCSKAIITSNFTSGTCFKAGTTTVTYTATDARGNASICSFTVTVKNPCANDTTKPVLYYCPTNITKETPDTLALVSFRAPTAVDNCGIKSLIASPKSGSVFQVGTTNVIYTATDLSNNTKTCSFTVTIKQVIPPCFYDTVPPVFTNCPADISVKTTSTSAIAQWTKPTATDNCSTPSVSSNLASGSNFPVGSTTVLYTAKDAKNNYGYCSFKVIVTKVAFVIDSNQCYVLVARSSRKALTIGYASTTAGADAVQWTYQNAPNQKWRISNADSNSVNLTVKHSNMNLDTRWGSLANGSRLMQWAKSAGATQKWQLIPTTDGYFKVVNKGSGRALSVGGGAATTTDGSLLVQLDYTGQASQQWSIESVPCASVTNAANFASSDMLDMSAKSEVNRARIEWVDNTGFKNDYYEVEKLNQTSGKFESLSIVNNKSFGNDLTAQTVYDNAPTEGDNIYRVKVVYVDSLEKISPVSKVNFSNVKSAKAFPNPASDFVDIDLNAYKNETVGVYLYNGFGKQVAFQNVQKGSASAVHFDISSQPTGQYLIRITAQGKRDVTQQLQIIR